MILVAALLVLYAVHVRIIRKDVEDKIIAKQMPQEQLQKLRKKLSYWEKLLLYCLS